MLPCQRQTRSQSKKRRAHDAMRPLGYVQCPNCGAAKLPHRACPECLSVPPRSGRQPGITLETEQEE